MDDVDVHRAWARQVARFAIVLGLLLDAHGSLLRARDELERERRRAVRTGAEPPPWVTRHLALTTAGTGPDRSAGASGGAVAGDERAAIEVPVAGHLKRQPYGPGNSLRRWIYVEGYEARRWVSPRPVRIVVS